MPTKTKKIIELPPATQAPLFRMIDVGQKRVTRRRAIACGTITVGREAFRKILEKSLPKGDVLGLAEIAGIMGAKKTPDLIPMCHTLPLDQVSIHCIPQEPDAVTVYGQVTAHAKTGVEMEAVMAVQAALATIWDLVKGTEPALTIGDVRLLVKEGGKSGLWVNPGGIPDWLAAQLPDQKPLKGLSAAIVIMSDRAADGIYEDKSGPVLKEFLQSAGARLTDYTVLKDDADAISAHLQKIVKQMKPDLVVTSGGTGLSRRDVTPETLEKICDRMVPGFGELLRKDGAEVTNKSWLSRSAAGMLGGTLIISLPGSPKAVREGMEALLPILPHALSMVCGGKHG
ncbi:MAG: bifunctional molybdenum cofactor biosynthesis protein MoaC/MoaB [Alphaproteobacteria bacterium]|nr:MAG: bifunctional molybdenum cofactor biosynthesis protein MoaC/MoaB [Alphaproteobacteria bacterium]